MHKSIKDLLTKDNQLRNDSGDILKGLGIPDDKSLTERQKTTLLKTIALLDSGIQMSDACRQAQEAQMPVLVVASPSEIVLPANNVDPAILDLAVAELKKREQEACVETIVNVIEHVPNATARHIEEYLLASRSDPKYVEDTTNKIKAKLAERFGI
ncbi:MAG: hypothetical protein ACRC80_01080 [Waterburya sp.]